MDEVLLGIDLGTSGAKAGLYTPEGKLLGLGRSAAYGVQSPHPGWSESDPEAWWRAVLESLEAACRAARVEPGAIAAVGLSVLFPVVVAMDGEGRALRPAILYSDQRSLEEAAWIEAAFLPGEYLGLSGNVASPGTCAATSVLWLMRKEPRIYERAATIGFGSSFLTARLAGARAADYTHAGLSGLVDIRRLERWEPRICGRLSLSVEKLPSIQGAASIVGTVTAAASRETGLRAGTPVVCGSGDAPCGSFGAGSIEPGSLTYVAGSTDCLTLPLRSPLAPPLDEHRWLAMGYVKPGLWLAIGTMTSAGMAVEWFADRFYPGSPDERRAAMTAEAEASAPSPASPLFLPYLQGERTPVWDSQARGLFTGLTLATTRGDMARAVFEGTALALRDVIACLGEESGGSAIRSAGGPMRNRFWTRLKAEVLGRPLEVLEFQETGSLGAALLAATARGHYSSLDEAAAAARRSLPVSIVEPAGAPGGYAERFARYRELYPATRELLHALAAP